MGTRVSSNSLTVCRLQDFDPFTKYGMFSPGIRLDRPYDEKTHARRPSDEGERILRKISGYCFE